MKFFGEILVNVRAQKWDVGPMMMLSITFGLLVMFENINSQ